MALIYLNEHLFLQLICHLILTLVYVCVFLVIKPYKNPSDNQREVFNELCVAAVSYTLLSINDPQASQEMREYVGLVYILICCFNLITNLSKIAHSIIFHSIP
jgi:hypothetical protein